jgi:hypothetical protein
VTVVLNEGEPEHTARFTIPEALLTKSFEYFQAARRNDWQEASSRIVRIPDVDVGTFNCYLHWVFRREITVQHELKKGYTSAQGAHGALEDLANCGFSPIGSQTRGSGTWPSTLYTASSALLCQTRTIG